MSETFKEKYENLLSELNKYVDEYNILEAKKEKLKNNPSHTKKEVSVLEERYSTLYKLICSTRAQIDTLAQRQDQ